MAEIRDPIHQFIHLSDIEVGVIDTRPVQRLREIHQLSTGSLVWPGAVHSRFEHALGTMELAGRAFDAAIRNTTLTNPGILNVLGWHESLARERARSFVRLAALLHDAGHAPFSHGPEHLFVDGVEHEHMSVRMILETEIADRLKKDRYLGVEPEVVADIAVGPKYRNGISDEPTLLLSELVTGSVGVDRWDYLLRDSLFSGVKYGLFDLERLLESLTIIEYQGGPAWALTAGGQYSAEQMLLARWFMFLNVYMHKTRRILDHHLGTFLEEYLDGGRFPEDIDAYLHLTDGVLLAAIRERPLHRPRLLERKHYRQILREFSAGPGGDFDSPEDFHDFCDNLGLDVIRDDFMVRPSPPGAQDFFVLDANHAPASMLDALDVVRPLESRWIGRLYAPPDRRNEFEASVQAAFEGRGLDD